MLAGCKTVDFMELEEWLMQISIILFCAVHSLQYLCREDRLRLNKVSKLPLSSACTIFT